jgi:TRAP-type C4-dicarboxylate transport system permease small subunit
MWYLIGVFIALLVCIFALLYTIKLGNSQGNNKEKYNSSKTYFNLSYIYGILFIFIVIIIFYFVVYDT